MYRRKYCNCNKTDDTMLDCNCNQYEDDEILQNCQCGFEDEFKAFPQDPTIAESYVAKQELNEVYKNNIGLQKGTIFPELVRTYKPCQSMEEIKYLRELSTIGEECENNA